MRPNSVDMPVATTTRVAAPADDERARVGHVLAVAERQPRIVEAVAVFLTAADSPVSAASSIAG